MKLLSNGKEPDRKMLGKYIFRLLLYIVVFLAVGLPVVMVILSGEAYFFSTSYGWEAVRDSFVIYGYLFWPVYVICGVLILCIGTYLRCSRGKYPKEEQRAYFCYIGKAVVKTMIGLGVLAVLFLAGAFFFSSTYSGAKI